MQESTLPTQPRSRKIVTYDSDAICIVPLHVGDARAQAPAPTPTAQLTYRNGPLLTPVEVFTIFWGAVWQKSPTQALVGQLNAFFDVILTSTLIDQLSEYSIGTQKITHGRRTGTATLTTPSRRRLSPTARFGNFCNSRSPRVQCRR